MPVTRTLRLLFVALLLIATTASSLAQDRRSQRPAARQPQTAVIGTVVEATTGAPIASATVALWNAADTSLVTGAITQEDGSFAIEGIRPGTYFVRVSFVGYRTQTFSDVRLTPSAQQVDLGQVVLEEDTAMLDEVEITADRSYIEVGVDKTSYNIKNQPMTAGGSGLDVLETIPSIEVDIDDNISLRGSENVAIYLNGKPAPMSGEALAGFLRGLAAESIERVEVIPNPSARYDPEGMSGIINIVLAKDQGQNVGGSLSVNADTRERYGGSANVHYGTGPWNLLVNYGLRNGQRESNGSQFRENRFLDPTTYLSQDLDGERGGLSHNLNATIDYRLSDQNSLSLSTLLSQRGNETDQANTYSELDAVQDLTRRYVRYTDGTRNDFNMDYRLSFNRTIDPSKHELSAEARYEQEWENDGSRYTEELLMTGESASDVLREQQSVDQDETSREASAQIDYRRPLGENMGMEAGYKGSFEQLDSRFYSETFDAAADAFQPDTNLNNEFVYDEQIHAVYGILSGELGPFGAQVGLRFERALTTFDLETTGESFNNNYASFYPSAHLTYQPTEGRTFKLSYSKRVRRPRTRQLNPFGDYDDPTSRREGNPFLTPEYTHSFEVGYTQMGGSYTLSLTPYYRHTVDAISWTQRLTEDGVTITTFDNFAMEDSYGAEIIGTLRLGRWLRTNASFNAYRRVTDGSNVETELSSSALGYMTRASASVSLPSDVELQLSQFYRSAFDVPGGHIDAFTKTDLAIQKKLMGDRASLSLRASDIFNQMGFELWRESPEYYQTFSRDFNAQGFQISFRYNFGQQDNSRRRNRGDRGEMDEGFEEMPIQ